MALSRPDIILRPFADLGDKNEIPVESQVGTVAGAASWETGFPPLTMIDVEIGGVAPDGRDFNGTFYSLSEHIRFINAGGCARFSATLVAQIGGYPIGVELQDDNGVNSYVNVLANNTTNFNTTPASIGVSWLLCRGPGLIVPDASTTVKGKIEIETPAETALLNGTTRAVASLGIGQLFAKGGNAVDGFWQKFPGGLMHQWGSVGATADTTRGIITFPVPFIAAAENVQTTSINNYEGASNNIQDLRADPYNYTTTGFSFFMNNVGGGGVATKWNWFAIGRWA